MLTALLCAAAFVAGLTGAWSPCGFSMVATIGEHGGSRGLKLAACLAFLPGALLGGAITFGAAAALGSLAGGGTVAIALAVVIATAGALAEAAGLRIAPQIRRQVPEHWRRTWPLPLAVGAYGVLLGLGFTTFVLTFAVPALTGVALAVGSLETGLAMGVAFGLGRALPVVALAPFATAPLGLRATELMAERPAILRGFRLADGVALAACALALGLSGAPAQAATVAAPVTLAAPATDPSAAGTELAYGFPGGTAGALLRDGATTPLDVARPAIGGSLLAVMAGTELRVARRATGEPVKAFQAPGADALAVSDRWVVYRLPGPPQQLIAVPFDGRPWVIAASVGGSSTLGRPALDGDRLVFHVAGATSSRITEFDLAAGTRRTVRRSSRVLLTNPSIRGAWMLYVETTPYSQSLRLAPRTGRGSRTLLRIAPAIRADAGHEPGLKPHRPSQAPERPAKDGPAGSTTTLWTTALANDAAYVTRLRELADGTLDTALLKLAR